MCLSCTIKLTKLGRLTNIPWMRACDKNKHKAHNGVVVTPNVSLGFDSEGGHHSFLI